MFTTVVNAVCLLFGHGLGPLASLTISLHLKNIYF